MSESLQKCKAGAAPGPQWNQWNRVKRQRLKHAECQAEDQQVSGIGGGC